MSWQRRDIDLDQPAPARIDNYVLGDEAGFEVDRAAAELIVQAAPSYPQWVRDNAGFIRRVVSHMLASGIRQFLDLGAGMGTTRGNVSQLARRPVADARVACVEIDPVAAAHLRAAAGSDGVSVHQLDLFAVDEVLHPDQVWRLLDSDKPVGVVLTSVLQYEPDASRIAVALRRYHDALAGGSMLAITHLTGARTVRRDRRAGRRAQPLGLPLTVRDGAELADLLGPWRPQPDGLVPPRLWRPDHPRLPSNTTHLGGAVLAVKTPNQHTQPRGMP